MAADMIVINQADNVGVMMRDVVPGDEIALPGGGALKVTGEIPTGHKVALRRIGQGEPVIKYGQSIGLANEDITAGEWVHTHNIKPL
jgi:altronate hydrolase